MILKLCKLIYEEHAIGKPPWKRGQRVVLLDQSPYMPDEGNPKQGSSYHCEGVITDMGMVGHGKRMRVLWDNGYSNDYQPLELSVIPDAPSGGWMHSDLDTNNPNVTFRDVKRRRELENQTREQQRIFAKSVEMTGRVSGSTVDVSYYTTATVGYKWN